MLETHFKDDPASTNNTSHTHVLPLKTLVDKIYDPKRLDEAVKSFDPDKAAGPDSIKPIILQKAWNLIKSSTRSIMIRSHQLQHIGCYLKGEVAKGAARLQCYNDWTVETAPSVKGTIKSHSYINNNVLNDLNISKKVTKDLTKPILILDRNYHITTPNNDDTTNYRKNLDKLIKESSDNTITCYTDRSRTDSGVGAGFLTTTNNSPHNIINYSSFKLPDCCSVFQAEVTAIREVTTTLQHNRSKTIVIWTE